MGKYQTNKLPGNKMKNKYTKHKDKRIGEKILTSQVFNQRQKKI